MLAQVETQLKTKDAASPPETGTIIAPPISAQNSMSYAAYDPTAMNVDLSAPMDGLLNTGNFEASPPANIVPDIDLAIDENFSWEMIGLGLEEPLPSQEAIDELYDLSSTNKSSINVCAERACISIKSIPRYL